MNDRLDDLQRLPQTRMTNQPTGRGDAETPRTKDEKPKTKELCVSAPRRPVAVGGQRHNDPNPANQIRWELWNWELRSWEFLGVGSCGVGSCGIGRWELWSWALGQRSREATAFAGATLTPLIIS
jgi:hypothetical protein